jgi:hypothetical protein
VGGFGQGRAERGLDIFGSGTGFVWYRGAQQKQVVQGALVDHVEAGLITMEQREGGGFRQALEGRRDARERLGGGIGIGGSRGGVDQLGFDGPGAAHAPTGGHHFLHHPEFEGAGGLELLYVLGQESLERLGGFVVEDEPAGKEAVAQGVLRRAQFAGGGGRTFGTAAVGAGGLDSSE